MLALVLVIACGISLLVFTAGHQRLRRSAVGWGQGAYSLLLSAAAAGVVLALTFIALWPPLDPLSTGVAVGVLALIGVALFLLGEDRVCQRQ